jgi:23S rRNA pseudouridine2605 synthase
MGSRREVETWISAGRVAVNGEPAHVGQRVSPTDRIEVDGVAIDRRGQPAPEIIILNKAAGVVCSRKDDDGRPTIFDDLPRLRRGRWISVGRLDLQTTGLLLLTNDGSLANRMMHPSTGLDREYAVGINARLEEDELT